MTTRGRKKSSKWLDVKLNYFSPRWRSFEKCLTSSWWRCWPYSRRLSIIVASVLVRWTRIQCLFKHTGITKATPQFSFIETFWHHTSLLALQNMRFSVLHEVDVGKQRTFDIFVLYWNNFFFYLIHAHDNNYTCHLQTWNILLQNKLGRDWDIYQNWIIVSVAKKLTNGVSHLWEYAVWEQVWWQYFFGCWRQQSKALVYSTR